MTLERDDLAAKLAYQREVWKLPRVLSPEEVARLSPQLLDLRRAWWHQCRSLGWLLPARDPFLPLTTRQLNRACRARYPGRAAYIAA